MIPPGGEAIPGARLEQRVSDRDFHRFQAIIHRESGIWLSPVKRALLAGRLSRRLREREVRSYREYLDLIEADSLERVHMIDCITTNETHFFREPRHFALLREELFPRFLAEAERGARARHLRIWSCACSTGEEPFSLAMAVLRAFPLGSSWDLEILASDLSTAVLERARAATWPLERVAEIPPPDLRAFMLRGMGPQDGTIRASPELRSLVRFAQVNLNDTSYPVLGKFDLLFCRNVLMYFAAHVKEQVVGRLLGHLAPGGYLFLGHAESLSGTSLPVRSVMPTVYQALPPSPRTPGRGAAP
jgi:chemotaxis protein methyltransferase CheR